MTRAKNRKKELESEEKVEEVQESKAPKKSDAPSQVTSFDAYFRKLMNKSSKIQMHHKAPMRKYAESKGLGQSASEKDFDEAFKTY